MDLLMGAARWAMVFRLITNSNLVGCSTGCQQA